MKIFAKIIEEIIITNGKTPIGKKTLVKTHEKLPRV